MLFDDPLDEELYASQPIGLGKKCHERKCSNSTRPCIGLIKLPEFGIRRLMVS